MANSLSFSLSSSTAPSIQAVLDPVGLAATFALTPLMRELIANGGAASLATVIEIMEPQRKAAKKAAALHFDILGAKAAHFDTISRTMTVFDRTDAAYMRARWELMRNPAVGSLIAEDRSWIPSAYAAAAAIKHNCVIVGNSRFFKRLAERVVIPGGVRHPITGDWLVPPRI